MKTNKLFLGLSVLALSIPNTILLETKALDVQKVGDFEVITSENALIQGDSIATASSSKYVIGNHAGNKSEFELNFTYKASATKDQNYGLVLFGEYEDEKLTGNVIRPYFADGSWRIVYGTLKENEFSLISDTTCDFGSNFGGKFKIAVYNGLMALQMDDWVIGSFELYYTEGETFFYADGASTTLYTPTQKDLTQKIGNYMYRNQWGGFNVHGYTKCYNKDRTHSFKMSIPSSVDKSTITELKLVRGAAQRNYGQKASVTINGVAQADWENLPTTNKINGAVDTYTDAVYSIPLNMFSDTNDLEFTIKSLDGEFVVRNYKLIMTINGEDILADKIINNSSLSEAEHNYTHDGVDWNGAQYLYLDMAGVQNVPNILYIGVKPLAKVDLLFGFTSWKGQDFTVTFTEEKDSYTIDFLDHVSFSNIFTFRNEVWFGTNKMSDNSVVELDNTTNSWLVTLDFFLEGLDCSTGGTAKFSPTLLLTAVGYNVEGGKQLVTVESDVEDIEKTGFVRLFNTNASNNFEQGTYKKGSKISYHFSGKSISVYGYVGKEGGSFKVTVDGNNSETFTSYADASDSYKSRIAKISSLEDKDHTLEIETLEEKWVAIDFFRFEITNEQYMNSFNLAQMGDIICSNPAPRGGGNKDLNVIRNEKIYAVGSDGHGPAQYDSFDGDGKTENVFYMGYEFKEDMKVSKVCFQAGCTWATGGWFKNGSLHLEAKINGEWQTVTLKKDIGYPNANVQSAFTCCAIYIFEFDQLTCTGVRIIGDAGGSEHFVSVSQIEVYANANTKSYCEGATYRTARDF